MRTLLLVWIVTLISPFYSMGQMVLWSEDFANGIPSGWVNESTDTINKPMAKWEYRGLQTSPNLDTGSRGLYARHRWVIQSPTRANGFVIFDSDWLHTQDISFTPPAGAAPAPHSSRLITPNLNLAAIPIGRLSFYAFARKFSASFKVCFSRDGGNSWPDTSVIFPELTLNEASSTGKRIDLNFLAGTNQVRIQWLFDGNIPLSNGATGLYFWMLDDVTVYEQPSNDLELESFRVVEGSVDTGVFGNPFMAITQSSTPYSSLSSTLLQRPITWLARINNSGKIAQSNVKLEVNIQKSGNSVFQQNSSPVFVPASGLPTSTSIGINQPAAPWLNIYQLSRSDTGIYDIIARAVSDSVDAFPFNNEIKVPYVISDSVFSSAYFPPFEHLMTRRSIFATNGQGSISNATDGCEVCSFVTLPFFSRIRRIGVHLAEGTQPGGNIVVYVRDTSGLSSVDAAGNHLIFSNPAAFGEILSSNPYTITSTDTASKVVWVPIPFLSPMTGIQQNTLLQGNRAYYLCARLFSLQGTARIALVDDQTIHQPGYQSIIFLPGSSTRPAGWFTNGNNFAIAAHFQNIILSNQELSLIRSMYPNPTSGEVNMAFESNTAADVNVVIRDITGREVYRQVEGKRMAGAHTLTINTDNLRNGIYTVELNVGAHRSVEKLSVYR